MVQNSTLELVAHLGQPDPAVDGQHTFGAQQLQLLRGQVPSVVGRTR